jgi:excisionase family DNA binding protein
MVNTQSVKEVMSRKEAAAYIGVGKSTLDRLAIPKIQIRRRVLFRKDAIDKWLLSQQTKTTTGTRV